MVRNGSSGVVICLMASAAFGITFVGSTPFAFANGLGEARPWQFDSNADKTRKALELDLMERKKGGYYDGITSVYTVTTNIGTQVNCANDASAIGNSAQNGQTGNAPYAGSDSGSGADSAGNILDSQDNGGVTNDSSVDQVDSEQDNSGSVGSSILNSPSSSTSTVSGLEGSVQDLENIQDNSGKQTAGVDSSTACAMQGLNLTGNVSVLDGASKTGPLN